MEGAKTDGVVVVVRFHIDNRAFVGGAGDCFSVFVEGVGLGHGSSFLWDLVWISSLKRDFKFLYFER